MSPSVGLLQIVMPYQALAWAILVSMQERRSPWILYEPVFMLT